jgi:hypothetical protein
MERDSLIGMVARFGPSTRARMRLHTRGMQLARVAGDAEQSG